MSKTFDNYLIKVMVNQGFRRTANQFVTDVVNTALLRGIVRKAKKAYTSNTRKSVGSQGAVKSKTKTRTGTVTKTRKRRTVEVNAPGGQYTRQNVAIGRRPRPTLKAAWKVLNSNKATQIWYHNAYSQMFGTQGNIPLQNVSTDALTGTLTCPCHLYDITAIPNVSGSTDGTTNTIVNPDIGWIPTFTSPVSTGLLNWVQPGRNWQISDSDTSPTAFETYPGGECMLEWFQAKMLFYAPLSFPCKFNVQVIQFRDDRFLPGVNGTQVGPFPPATAVTTVQTSFWKSMLKKYMHSPLEDGDGKLARYIKVLYQNEFILDPKESTEATNTIFRQVNIFMNLNRSCKYNWNDEDNIAMTTSDTPTNNSVQVETTVHPKKRIFLMIRAMARNGAAFSTASMPSYDLVLKKKTSQLAA